MSPYFPPLFWKKPIVAQIFLFSFLLNIYSNSYIILVRLSIYKPHIAVQIDQKSLEMDISKQGRRIQKMPAQNGPHGLKGLRCFKENCHVRWESWWVKNRQTGSLGHLNKSTQWLTGSLISLPMLIWKRWTTEKGKQHLQ